MLYFTPTLFGRFNKRSQTRSQKNERNVSSGTETVNRTTLVVFSLVKEFHSASEQARPRGDLAQGPKDRHIFVSTEATQRK